MPSFSPLKSPPRDESSFYELGEMHLAGGEVTALWREAGAWWAGESPLEIQRMKLPSGKRRDDIRRLSSPWGLATIPTPYVEDNTEEIILRPRKTRDEKVSKAIGLARMAAPIPLKQRTKSYAPLHVLSGYSFGESICFAEEIPRRCATLGIPAVALVDHFALTGAVEHAREAKKCGIKPLIGTSVELAEGGWLVLIAQTKRGYSNLSQLITECHLGEPRLFPLATWERIARYHQDVLCLTAGDYGRLNRLLAGQEFDEAEAYLRRLIGLFGRENVYVEIERSFLPWEIDVNRRLKELAEKCRVPCVAGGRVTHPTPADFPAQDVLMCSETLCLVDEIIGRKPQRAPDQRQEPRQYPRRAMNHERYLRSPDEVTQLFEPELLDRSLEIAARCEMNVLPERTQLPSICDDPNELLKTWVWEGAKARYPTLNPGLKRRINHELGRICALGFANHFLIAQDACNWATEHGILYSGRGSVVDAVVAYCLGFSRIDAYRHHLHFDRFLPEDGSKRPDIDIDFEAHRRDDVRNYMTQKYGVDRVATVAAIGAFNTRGIVREVGKALGLPNETIGYLAKRIHGGVPPDQLQAALAKRPELIKSGIPSERFGWVFRLGKMLADVPRNMRAHSSGVIIADRPIAETVPVQWSGSEQVGEHLRIIQWDKRSSKYYFDKFDVLCLRGQDVLSGTQVRTGIDVQNLSLEDEDTYRAMRSGELIGIPQSASPAMRQAHVRLQTASLEDAALVQAGIRPGVGGAVKINELIARRHGKPYSFEHPELERILGLTYGLVVFQEQVDMLLQSFCDYSSGEAEDIRDAIHKKRREDYGQLIKTEMIERMMRNGFTQAVAEHVFELVAGFKGYGFAQGHALAFAEISIRSIYLQQNYPAEYFAALLSAQPAGYYGPCTIANEARVRGVQVLPPDVHQSEGWFSVEDVISTQDPRLHIPHGGIRTGLMQIAAISQAVRERILSQRPFEDFFDFALRVRPNRDEMEQLIQCGALDEFCPNRRAMLWAIPTALAAQEGELDFEHHIDHDIQDFNPIERAVRQRLVLGMDVSMHLMGFERDRITAHQGLTTMQVRQLPPGHKAMVVGNPIRLRFPPTPSGKRVVFFDLEDETGLLNVTCFDAVYRRDGHAIVCSPYVTIIGETQSRDGFSAFLARRVFPYDPRRTLAELGHATLPQKTGDFLVG